MIRIGTLRYPGRRPEVNSQGLESSLHTCTPLDGLHLSRGGDGGGLDPCFLGRDHLHQGRRVQYLKVPNDTFADDPKLGNLALVNFGLLCTNVEQSPLWYAQRFGHDVCKISAEKKRKKQSEAATIRYNSCTPNNNKSY